MRDAYPVPNARRDLSPPERTPPLLADPAEPTLGALMGMLFRHRLVIAGCIVAAVLLDLAYTAHAHPVYESSAMIRYEAQHVNVPQLVDVVADDNMIATEIEVLRDRTAAVAAIDSLGLRARLVAPANVPVGAAFPLLRIAESTDSETLLFHERGNYVFDVSTPGNSRVLGTGRVGDTVRISGVTMVIGAAATGVGDVVLHVDPLDAVVAAFQRALDVSRPARDADIIAVRFRSDDPGRAAAVANLIAESVIADRQEANRDRTGSAMDFLRQQDDSLGRQLHAAEDSLRGYQTREHIVDAPQQESDDVSRLAKMQADLAGVRAERDALAQLVVQLKHDSATGVAGGENVSRRLMAFPTLLSDQSASVLLGALAQVETERAQLLMRRTPGDSDVQVLTRRIRDIESQLGGIAYSYLLSLTNQTSALEREAATFSAQLDALPAKALAVARLERDTSVLSNLSVLVQTRLKEAQVSTAGGDHTFRVVDAAVASNHPTRPRPLVNLAVALLLGTMLGMTSSLVLEVRDGSVRSRSDALAASGLPVLGALPRLHLPRRSLASLTGRKQLAGGSREGASIAAHLVTRAETPAAYTESLNQLYANLVLAHAQQPVKVIVFTSALSGEGKTLSAVNFALTGAMRGLDVLLIDADLRCGVISDAFAVRRTPGLAEVLAGTASLTRALQRVDLGDQGSLAIISSGALPRVAGRVLTVDRIRQVLSEAATHFDFVVVDTPPVNLLSDAGVLGAVADAVVLVVRAGHTQVDDLQYAMDQLDNMRVPVIGTLLNDIDLRRHARDDGSYRYLVDAGKYHVVTS